jgi:N-methylhydantoinase A
MMRVATDVGGTFTDLAYFDEETGRSGAIKVDTTPPDFERGVIGGLQKSGLDPSEIELFAHGTTVIINALTERKGAKTGLVTTRGFRDVLEIARGNRPDLYNFYFSKPKPFVPRYLRKEVEERLDHKGAVLIPLDVTGLEPVADFFREEGVEAVAVSFVHSYANPTHELEAARVLEELLPGVSVIPAHHVTREWREYERTNTAVLSTYVHPAANEYLDSLERKLDRYGFGGRLFVMQSNGGSATVRVARSNPIGRRCSPPTSLCGYGPKRPQRTSRKSSNSLVTEVFGRDAPVYSAPRYWMNLDQRDSKVCLLASVRELRRGKKVSSGR